MKTDHLYRALRTIVVFLAGVLVFACGEKEPDNPEPPGPETFTAITERGAQIDESGIHIDMPETSVFVKEDINNYLIEYDEPSGRLVFQTCDAIDKAEIKVGDVLFSGVIPEKAPEGYLVKVNSITKNGSKTIFETSKAGLGDAFETFEFNYSLKSILPSPEDITVFDPFSQDNLMPFDDPMTRGINVDLDFSKNEFKLEGDKFSLEFDEENQEFTVEIVVMDLDDDYEKTKNDQTRLEFKIEYELEDGDFKFNKHGEDGFVSGGTKIKVGGFAGLKWGAEKKNPKEDWLINKMGKEELNAYKTKVEEKLMGKKIRVFTWEIPVKGIPVIGPVLAAIISPRLDLYFVYNIKLEGAFRAGFVWEKAEFDFHSGNSSDDFSQTDDKKTWFNVDLGDVHPDIIAECDVKGSVGAGVGIVTTTSKTIDFLYNDVDNKPYIGGFFEFTANADLKFKSDFNFLDHIIEGSLKGDAYFKTEAFLEGYARAKGKVLGMEYDWLWHVKIDWPRLTYKIPDPPKEFVSWPFKLESEYPIPFCLSPENHSIISDNQVDLQWDIPFHMHAGTAEQGYFDGINYTIYANIDRTLVEQSSPQAKVAEGLQKGEKSFTITIDPMETYYWKVVCTNQYGWDFASQIWSFDTGYNGVIQLNTALKKFLADYRDTLPGVRIEKDGTIYRTPSNLVALSQVTTLVLQDPEHKYNIESIDDLLIHLPSLETLNCKHNSIRSLNLANNLKLKGIACGDNPILSLDLSGAPNLGALNCSENKKLTALDLTQCPELITLDCSKCSIEEIDLSHNQKLQNVYASENRLSYLDISRCPNLIRLDVYSQSVERLKLRLTHTQMDNFALFKRHVNMDFEFVDLSGIQTDEAIDITGTTAKVTVTVFETGSFSALGIVYSHVIDEPTISSEYTESIMYANKMNYTFQLKDLKPDTRYAARGVARDANTGLFKYGNVVYFRTGKGEPEPRIRITPYLIDFGDVYIGKSKSKSLEIQNVGDADLTYRIVSPENSPFNAYPTAKNTLAPGDCQTITITFNPREEGEAEGEFIVKSNDPHGDDYFVAWGTGSVEYVPISNIVFVPNKVTLGRGDRYTFSIKVLPENATDRDVIYSEYSGYKYGFQWTISDENVIVSDSRWEDFLAIGAGEATVTAVFSSWNYETSERDYFYPTCQVTVVVYIDKLFIVEGNEVGWEDRPCPKNMIVGESQSFKVKYEPEDATETDLIWKSDDPSIATVSVKGVVTALKPGKTTIRCMVATEVRGHIEVDWDLEVKYPSGSHEGFHGEYWD